MTISEPAASRRERKKAATRTAISNAALSLFLEHGFDGVSIRDIAEEADVAVATIFAHFSGKEALVFDEDSAMEESLIAAVTQRAPQTDALTALETWFMASRTATEASNRSLKFDAFQGLVQSTPVLREYWRNMWRRYEPGLAAALAETTGQDVRLTHLVATLAIEGYLRAAEDDRPDHALRLLFQVLRSGSPLGG
jgi:AcrR family transcriptional regulator